jgi:hypothetical protein
VLIAEEASFGAGTEVEGTAVNVELVVTFLGTLARILNTTDLFVFRVNGRFGRIFNVVKKRVLFKFYID